MIGEARIRTISFRRRAGRPFMIVSLSDARELALPLSLYPTLANATPAQRAAWRSVGRGIGINWPDLDLDLSLQGMLAGYPERASGAERPRRHRPVAPVQGRAAQRRRAG